MAGRDGRPVGGRRRPGRPARRPGTETTVKEKMLAVATRLFAEKGFRAVSIRTIATRSGVTLSSLYHHFGDKRNLYREAHLKEFTKSSVRLESALRRGDALDEQLLSFVTELCRVLSEPGPLFKLVARHWLDGDPDVFRSLVQPVQFNHVVRAIGAIAPARDPKGMALTLCATVHGLVTLRPFEDSIAEQPAVAWTPVPMAEFVLTSLLPEADWKQVAKRLEHHRAFTGSLSAPGISAAQSRPRPP